jgi:hypothetical protein
MTIKREQLKVGETYQCDLNYNTTRRVEFIGSEFIVYKRNSNDGKKEIELSTRIESFLASSSIIPKPKTKVYLYEIFSPDLGYFAYLREKDLTKYQSYKKLENYFIEVYDE